MKEKITRLVNKYTKEEVYTRNYDDVIVEGTNEFINAILIFCKLFLNFFIGRKTPRRRTIKLLPALIQQLRG